MFGLICKKLLLSSGSDVKSLTQLYFLLHNPSSSLKSFSSTNRHPDSVLNLFRNYGFTETRISSLVNKSPSLLLYNPEKTLNPKLDFFSSVGISPSDLAKILSADHGVLRRSLDNQIIPSFQFLKTLLHTNDNVIAAIKRSTWILKHDLGKYMAPNIAILRDHGVPDSKISTSLKTQPRAFIQEPNRFREIVAEVNEMGFDPLRYTFILAIHSLTGFSKLTWERKSVVYRRWGWSDGVILSAFKKKPTCMMASEKKIEKVMDFLVNTMGWEALDVAGCPGVILSSLEKWIIPRCSVVQLLLSKGLVKKKFSLSTVLSSGEKKFSSMFVTKHCVEVPELLNLYPRKADRLGLTVQSEGLGGTKNL